MPSSRLSTLISDLKGVLDEGNGFYAFEGALHFRALQSSDHEEGIVAWNDQDSWRKDYGDLADGLLFFAEDAFGGGSSASRQMACFRSIQKQGTGSSSLIP